MREEPAQPRRAQRMEAQAMSKTLIVDRLVRDEGTILVLQGHDPDTGRVSQFAADHRLGWSIVDALLEGEEVPALVEPYQVLAEWAPKTKTVEA